MGKQINYSQKNSKMGNMKGILRILGKRLFFKHNNNQYQQQIIQDLSRKGAKISIGGRGWILVDMFHDIDEDQPVKLLNKEFLPHQLSDIEVEAVLAEFYLSHFTKAGFQCELKEIN